MKKILNIALLAAAVVFAGCENYFDEKYLDNGKKPYKEVKTINYELIETDYVTIAANKTNKAYAEELDAETGDSTNIKALAEVGTSHYFNDIATPDKYLPIFIYNKYPHFDKGSVFNATYLAWNSDEGEVEVAKTSFTLLEEGWVASLSTYYKQAVAGDGSQGDLVIQDFDMEDGITYIWTFDNTYGMKGTAYKSGPHYGEGWVVTPAISLKRSVAPALSFDMAMNYGPLPEDGRYEQFTVWVSTDYVDDVRTATWTQLEWNMFDDETGTGFPEGNSWTFYNTGRMDLSPWNDQEIYIGFRYKSVKDQTCSTSEFKNILISEPKEE